MALQTISQPLFADPSILARTPRTGLDREVLSAQRRTTPSTMSAGSSRKAAENGTRAGTGSVNGNFGKGDQDRSTPAQATTASTIRDPASVTVIGKQGEV